MGWTRLELDPDARESTLQQLFDRWSERATISLAGLPYWMAALKPAADLRPWHDGRGYRWQADAELEGAKGSRWIVELKHAAKWEPQALAEVLHHVQALEEELGAPVEPVVISSYNCWLRMALKYLRQRAVVVRYCEAYVLEDVRRAKLIWFDDPFAEYKSVAVAPDVLPDQLKTLEWAANEEGSVWRAMCEGHAKPGVPFVEGKYAQLAAVNDKRFVLWLGEGAARQSSRAQAKALMDRYFVSSSSSNEGELNETIRLWLNERQ